MGDGPAAWEAPGGDRRHADARHAALATPAVAPYPRRAPDKPRLNLLPRAAPSRIGGDRHGFRDLIAPSGEDEDEAAALDTALASGAHDAGEVASALWRPVPSLSIVSITRTAFAREHHRGALRRLCYAQEEMTAYGFPAMAATLDKELGIWTPDAIKRQHAHTLAVKIGRTVSA